MTSRRAFLRTSLRGSSLIALAPSIPGFLARTARAADPEADGRVLVVVQLDGGNDGINTVVPFGDTGYARHRSALRLPDDRLLKIDDRLALHPSMGGAMRLLESGRLAIVPGVGYPNPNRSHFESMAIWQTARLDPDDRTGPRVARPGLRRGRRGLEVALCRLGAAAGGAPGPSGVGRVAGAIGRLRPGPGRRRRPDGGRPEPR